MYTGSCEHRQTSLTCRIVGCPPPVLLVHWGGRVAAAASLPADADSVGLVVGVDAARVRVVPGLEAAGRPGVVLQAARGRPPHRAALHLGPELETRVHPKVSNQEEGPY